MSEKKKPANANDGGASAWQKFKGTWEYRSLKFVFRLAGWIMLVYYLAWGGPQAKTWAEILLVRQKPIETLPAVAEQYLAEGRPDKLHEWVSKRHPRDLEETMALLEPYTGKISSMTFLMYSKRLMDRGDTAEAVFWHQYGLFRLRFDALRCGVEDAVEIVTGFLELVPNTRVQRAIQSDPDLLRINIQRVLKLDAKYPAENVPRDTCEMVRKITSADTGILPRENWRAVRHVLRMVTEEDMKKMSADPDRPAPGTGPAGDAPFWTNEAGTPEDPDGAAGGAVRESP